VWDRFLSDEDRAVFEASGWGAFLGIGERPALLVTDVIYGFTGHVDEPMLDSIATWPASCGPNAWAAIPHIQRLLAAFRGRHMPVFYSKGMPPRADGLGSPPWRSARLGRPPAPPAGFDGFDVVREIAPEPRDVVITKSAPSVFFDTHLMAYLTSLRVDSLILCGTTTSGCVRATAIDGFSHHLRVAVAEEATFDRGEASHAMSLFDLNAKYADVMPTADIVAHIQGMPDDLYPELHARAPATAVP
jgi:nicotinamidase-related amidase